MEDGVVTRLTDRRAHVIDEIRLEVGAARNGADDVTDQPNRGANAGELKPDPHVTFWSRGVHGHPI
jgi:hypothetical protein